MSIVFVLGGHGSGKSTVVRGIMSGMEPIHVTYPERKYPIGYRRNNVCVLGHYEIPNGGADTVRPLTFLHATCEEWARAGNHVVLEGIGQAGIFDQVLLLLANHGGSVMYLTTPLDVCVASVRARGHRLAEHNIRAGYIRAERMANRFGEGVYRVDRSKAVATLRRLIR